jgi:ABC-type glycerol-3-phosphate transport system substrate-binding protein
MSRRDVLRVSAAAGAGLATGLASPQVMAQSKPDSISLICNNGGWFGQLRQGTIPAWEKKTGIKMETVFLPNESLKTKLRTELSGGSSPYDVVIWTAEWRGWIAPYLDDHHKLMPKFDWEDIPEPAKLFGAFKGKQLGVPYRFTVMMLHYQKKLLEAAGISTAPGTFAELEKAAKATTKDGRYGLAIFGKQGAAIVNGWLPYLFSAGGDLYNEDTSEIKINKPEAIRALDYFGKLVKEGVTPPAALTWEWDEIIAGGQNDLYAMSVMHAPYGGTVSKPGSKTAGNWAWSQMPGADRKDQGKSWVLGWLVSIPTASKKKDWAADFVSFACGKEQMLDSMKTNNLPPRSSILNNNDIIAKNPWIPETNIALQRAAQVPSDEMWDQLEQRLRPAISQVILGQSDAKTALNAVADDWTKILKRARKIK